MGSTNGNPEDSDKGEASFIEHTDDPAGRLNTQGDERELRHRCKECGKWVGSQWIDCAMCNDWYHQRCAGVEVKEGENVVWMCASCKALFFELKEQKKLEKQKEKESPKVVSNTAGEEAANIRLERKKLDYESDDEKRQPPRWDFLDDFNLNAPKKAMKVEIPRNLEFSREPFKDEKRFKMTSGSGWEDAKGLKVPKKSRWAEDSDEDDDYPSRAKHNARKFEPTPSNFQSTGNNELNAVLTQLTKLMVKQNIEPLPEFSGELDKWPLFYAQYKNTKDHLTDEENMQRLRVSVKGDANKAARAKLSYSKNPDEVISILKELYGRADVAIRRIVMKLRNLPPPDENSAKDIRNFKNEVEEAYVTLLNLEAETYLMSPTLVDDVLLKLPVPMKRNWGQYAHSKLRAGPGEARLKDLVQWLEEYTKWTLWETLETKAPQRNSQSSSQGRVNVHMEPSEEDKNKCWACRQSGHILVKCPEFLEMSTDDRWELAKKKNLCFCCLNRRHRSECQKKKECGVSGCTKFHNQLLHPISKKTNEESVTSDGNGNKKTEDKSEPKGETSNEKKNETFSGTINAHIMESGVHFRILPVNLMANGKIVAVNAFFDDGSSQTLLSQSTANLLNLKGTKEPLSLTWTDNRVKYEKNSEIVSVEIRGISENARKYVMRNVRTVEKLLLPKPKLKVKELQESYDYMKGIRIPQPFDEIPAILIGLNNAKLTLPYEKREGKWDQPIVTNTRLGWVVHGQSGDTEDSPSNFTCVVNSIDADEDLHQMVNYYFTTESFGVRPSTSTVESKEEIRAKEILQETTKKTENGYEVGLLWKTDDVELPDSREMALRRFVSFEKQMERDPKFGKACRDKFKEQIDKGFIRKVTPDELDSLTKSRHWYLPVFAVKHPNKNDKIRLVYDAAAKCQGVSLNDALLKGPDLLMSLVGVLFRAREEAVAIASDINDMFPSIKIKKEDQPCQLFFFREKTDEPIEVYMMTSMTPGAICSPSAAQWVKNSNAQDFQHQYPRAAECIQKGHYMDDAIDSLPTEDVAIQTARQVETIHKRAGFTLKKWTSNSSKVMTELNGSEESPVDISLQLDTAASERILGMYWNTEHDMLTFRVNFAKVDPKIVNLEKIPTKREILKTYMSVFDPLGMLTPMLLNTKILLQRVWREGFEWDQQVSHEIFEIWCECMKEMKSASQVNVPRCYFGGIRAEVNIELHTFCDASEEAFSAVSYFRFVPREGEIEVSFVASKCKVAPLKHLSIPRLELQAAVLASRLATTIIEEHRYTISRKHFWSDSQTVLSWITSGHWKYKQFVANRISEILDHSAVREWHWIPTKRNVADEGTKHKAEIDMSVSGRWFSGPKFLKERQEEWCFKNPTQLNTTEELKRVNVHVEVENSYSQIDASRFSNWTRLVRGLGYAWRFVQNCLLSRSKSPRISGPLKPDEIHRAENVLWKKIQFESFPSEVTAINQEKAIEKSSRLHKLSPIVDPDEGVIRMKGRIDAAKSVNEDFKRPIILDRRHPITKLLIKSFHDRFHHANTETIVAELRKRFWIIEVRVAVKNVAKDCQACKNRKSAPVVPEMSPLPEWRLMASEKPFTYASVDYMGPFMVTIGRRHEKRWVALFVCLVTRGVHIELVSSLDTNSCIMATRNFMLRRGPAKLIFSDNATCFHGADNELKNSLREIDQKRLQEESPINLPGEIRTEWKFNTPLGSHMAGVHERLVRSVKTVLYSCLKERSPKEEVLRNFLMEAEYTVNSRPLTYQTIEPDTLEPLTPNRILQLGGQIVYSPGVFSTNEIGRKTWRFSQQLADEFWARWIREYLPVLTKRTKWFKEEPDLKVGDIVIIVEDSAPRNLWKRGIVEQVHPGVDNKVRSATVRTAIGVYKRPVAKLARLDVRSSSEE